MNRYNFEIKKLPLISECDVVVCGSGPAGFTAAIAAARNGSKTFLIEKNGYPGGMMTAGFVNPIYGFFSRHIQVVRGIAQEFIEILETYPGGTTGHKYRFDCVNQRLKIGECYSGRDESICPVAGVSNVCAIDSELAKAAMIQMLESANVSPLYHTSIVDVDCNDSQINGIVVHSKSGFGFIRAKIVIDTTGDADVAALSGVNFQKGFGETGINKPPSLMFKVSGVQLTHDRIRFELPESKPGEEAFGWLMALPAEGDYTVNAPSGLLGFDSTDSKSLSAGQAYATQAMMRLFLWIKENVPGCENIRLRAFAPHIGIRDSRRIEGGYELTENDILNSRKFPETGIANGVHPIDLHIKDEALGGENLILMPCGDYYQIPFECLLPKGIDNLLVAGRSISANFLAQGSLRVMATCMGIGQAAGTAAALAISQNKPVGKIDVKKLRETLINQGAYLGEEENLPTWNLGREPLPRDIKQIAYPQQS